jgi:hypothetical protein
MKNLAAAFSVLARDSTVLESKAEGVLKILKAEKIKDLKSFNASVREAYDANGWNPGAGRPKADEKKREPVPPTVKQYVSAIRRAFRLKMMVLQYSSFSALRSDLKKEASKVRKPRTTGPKELHGIRLAQPEQMTGGTFHDLAVLYAALDRTRKPKMLAALERIKRDFGHTVPQLVAEMGLRKAA